jgi:histidinol-phosphate aminotransferase
MKHKKPHFPREDYATLELYRTERDPVDVDLSDNTNLWGAHSGALAAVRAAAERHLTRYPDFYADELREAAAERFGVGPGNVCTGCGSDHILDSAFRTACASGGLITYAAPSFIMVEYFARLNGRTTRPIPWPDAISEPSRLLAGGPVLVYVCRPNNPTGLLAPREWVLRLLDAAGTDGPLVVVDEAYAEFAPPGESLVKEAATHPRLLVARTLSKAFGLAGLRVGVGVASPEVAREMEKARGPYMVSSLAEAAAVRVLRDEEGWVTRTVAECLKNRERLVNELRARGLDPLPTAANFVMVPVREGCALRYAKELRAKSVAIRPFPAMFGSPEGIRVTVAPWKYMERFLSALDEVLAADAACEADVVVQVQADKQAAEA